MWIGGDLIWNISVAMPIYGSILTPYQVWISHSFCRARNRGILLITGDNALRQAAIKECVDVKGTIGLLDSIYEQHLIDRNRYVACLEQFIKHNERRLPVDELEKRIQKEGDEHEND